MRTLVSTHDSIDPPWSTVAGIGSALAVAAALEKHNVPGRVKLLGTPAEEADGGKIVMLNNGGYKDMDVSLTKLRSAIRGRLESDLSYRCAQVCLMAHPTPYTALAPMLAVSECDVEFFGHKSVCPGLWLCAATGRAHG